LNGYTETLATFGLVNENRKRALAATTAARAIG